MVTLESAVDARRARDYSLVVRATDGEGDVQEFEEDRGPYSGVSGFHKINVRVTA